jgi:hypothetical protein
MTDHDPRTGEFVNPAEPEPVPPFDRPDAPHPGPLTAGDLLWGILIGGGLAALTLAVLR